MKKAYKPLVLLIALFLAATVAAACGGDDTAEDSRFVGSWERSENSLTLNLKKGGTGTETAVFQLPGLSEPMYLEVDLDWKVDGDKITIVFHTDDGKQSRTWDYTFSNDGNTIHVVDGNGGRHTWERAQGDQRTINLN
jgi:hypothetical protein